MTAKDDIFTTDDKKVALMIWTPSDRLYTSSECSNDDHQLAIKKRCLNSDDQKLSNSTNNPQPAARSARNDTT